MAVINITKGFNGLSSVYNPNYLEFEITEGTTPTVEIEGILFAPVKIANFEGVDTYVMDFQDILKNILPLPPQNINPVYLSKQVTATISAPASTSKTSSTVLTYAYDRVRETNSQVFEIEFYGARKKQYYYDQICFYFSGTAGMYTVQVGDVYDEDVFLENGYNFITVNGSGIFTVLTTEISFEVIQLELKNPTSPTYVTWINSDGNFIKYEFEKISESENIVTEKEIPIYNYSYGATDSLSRDISKKLTRTVRLKTVAINTEHFAILTEIAKSLVIGYDLRFWKVKSIPNTISECRQNLSFTLELEMQDYVPSH